MTVQSRTESSLRAVDPISGEMLWVKAGTNSFQSTPAIGEDGTIYVGNFDKFVYAIDPETGATKWQHLTGDSISASVAIGPDGTLYVGAHDGRFYALDSKTGARKWEFLTGDSIHSSAAIAADGTVYFGSYDQNIYALDGESGEKKWSFRTGGLVLASPLIGPNGTVYVGSYDGKLYALEGSAPPADGIWPTFKGNSRRSGLADETLPVRMANPRIDPTGVQLEVLARAGRTHALEFKESLKSSDWTTLGARLFTNRAGVLIDPTSAPGPSRFYRVRAD